MTRWEGGVKWLLNNNAKERVEWFLNNNAKEWVKWFLNENGNLDHNPPHPPCKEFQCDEPAKLFENNSPRLR